MGLRIHRRFSRASSGKTVVLDGDGGFIVPNYVICFSLFSALGDTVNFGTAIGTNDYLADVILAPAVWNDQNIFQSFPPGTKLYISGNVNPIILKIRF